MHARDGLKNGIGILRGHGIELAYTRVSVTVVYRSELRIELIYQRVKLLIRQGHGDFVSRIRAECERGAFGPVELPETGIQIGCVSYFDVIRE